MRSWFKTKEPEPSKNEPAHVEVLKSEVNSTVLKTLFGRKGIMRAEALLEEAGKSILAEFGEIYGRGKELEQKIHEAVQEVRGRGLISIIKLEEHTCYKITNSGEQLLLHQSKGFKESKR